MRKLVFDIETKNLFEEVGKADPALLDISIVCVWDSETDQYTSYLEEELPKLWPLIEKTEMLIGYNSDHFDIPLLDKYYPGDLKKIKSLDLLKEIRASIGRRVKLDSVAEATLGVGKNGHGLEAVRLWREGNITKLREYCINDVKITKEVYEYAIENHKLFYRDVGAPREIKLDTSAWENDEGHSMTFTLPF